MEAATVINVFLKAGPVKTEEEKAKEAAEKEEKKRLEKARSEAVKKARKILGECGPLKKELDSMVHIKLPDANYCWLAHEFTYWWPHGHDILEWPCGRCFILSL